MTPADIIKKYIEIRDFLERDQATADARRKPYVDAMTALEGAMAQHMQDTGTDSVKADGIGTAFHKTNTHVRVADRAAFNEFVQKTGDLSYFTNAVSKEMILDYIKANEAPPPGVDFTRITEVQFRRA